MLELTGNSKALVKETVMQLLEKLAADGRLTVDALLEMWVEIPGHRHPRGTFRGGFLMPDSFIYLADYFKPGTEGLHPSETYGNSGDSLERAWHDLFDELYYQIEIFTSQVSENKGITVELWAGCRQRPEGEWIYAVDRKIELI
jgi:hypothetical protein